MTYRKLLAVSAAALMLAATGCTTTEEVDEEAQEFPDNAGQDPLQRPEQRVHPGPYSFQMQGIIPPFKFFGYTDRLTADYPDFIYLSDFYNPDGNGFFPEGHVLAGQPKPKALVLMMSAVWCGPCQIEAQTVMPVEVPKRRPDVQFLSVLIDGQDPGTPATMFNLNSWSEKYQLGNGLAYPIAIDPTSKISTLYEAAFPGNMIIDTRDMRMVYRVAGVMNDGFWTVVENVVDGGL